MVQSVSIKFSAPYRSLGGKFDFLTPLIRNSGTPYVLKICNMFINNALQEDSLLKCFKSYFEEKKTFYCTLILVGL